MFKRRFFLTVALMSVMMSACSLFEDENHITVDEEQLYGKWREGTSQVYWRYASTGQGVTWDESEIEEQASNLTFVWSVNGDELLHVFTGDQENQAVPKKYTITEIDNSHMLWRDDYGLTKSLTKEE